MQKNASLTELKRSNVCKVALRNNADASDQNSSVNSIR